MLADWYFCSALMTPPTVTQPFLEILDILDSPHTSAELLHDAIGELDRCEPWMRAYAAHQLLAAVRRVPAGGVSAELAHDCLSRLSQSLSTAMGSAVRDVVAALLLGHEYKRAGAALTALAARCAATKGGEASTRPYIDLPDFYPESLLLAFLLDFVEGGGSVRSLVESADDESPVSEFLLAAERGRYGRLAVLYAVRLAAVVEGGSARDRLLDVVWGSSLGVAWLEPDLLAATARLLFDTDRATRPVTAEPLEFEAITGTELRRLRAAHGPAGADHVLREAAVFECLGGVDAPMTAWGLVLWQTVLWELAAKRYPVDAADRLRRWWRAPDRGRAATDYPGAPVEDLREWTADLNALLNLRGTEERPLFTCFNDRKLEFSPDRAAEVFSPWVYRNHGEIRTWKADPNGTRPKNSDSYQLDRGAGMLRFLTAAPIALDLLRHPQVRNRDHLLEFVVHSKDVLDATELREVRPHVESQQADASAIALPSPLRGLALYVNYNIERAGRGTLAEIEPSWFVDLVLAGAAPAHGHRLPHQSWLLHERASRLVLVSWLTEVLSAITGPQDQDPHARWLRGDPSPAHRLIEAVLDQVGRRASYTAYEARNAALIARFRLPGVGLDTRSWNWRSYRKHAPWQWYLLAESSALTDWDQAFDRLGRTDNVLCRLAGLTECMAALLHADAEPESEPRVGRWSEEWLSEITAVSEPRQFPRQLQIRLVQLLNLDELTGHDWQRWVLEQIVDALVEFGIRKPAELSMIFRALSRTSELAELLSVLRSRFLEVIYLSQQVRHDGTAAGRRAISPWLVGRERTSIRLFDLSLRRLLHQLRDDEPAMQNTHTPREQARLGWAQARKSPELGLTTTTAGHHVGAAESRFVVGLTVDPFRDLVRAHLLKPAWSADEVTDLFGVPELRARFLDTLGRDCRFVVGIVCADQPGDVRVNCGLGHPVAVPAQRVPQPWQPRMGEFVAVPLRRNDLARCGCEVGEQLRRLTRRAATSGDVRTARLSTSRAEGRQVVRVRVDEVEFELTPQVSSPWRWTPESLNQWDPDLSRGHRTDAGESWQTLARWDEASGRWMPVDRTLTELVADGVQDGSHRGVVVLVGRSGDDKWQLSTGPGLNYLVADAEWWEGDADQLAAKVEETGSDAAGLLVYVELVADDDGIVRLRLTSSPPEQAQGRWPGLDPEGPFDHRNLRWRDAFDVPLHFGEFDGERWFCDTEILGFPPVQIRGLPPAARGDGLPFMPQRWGWSDQRLAVVGAAQQASFDLKAPSGEDRSSIFERLHELDHGTHVMLRRVLPLPEGSVDCRPALTTDSLHVLVTAESVNPGHDSNRVMHFSHGRPAEVIRIEELPVVLACFATVSTHQMLDQVEPELRQQAEAALRSGQLRGLVVSSPKRRAEVQTYGLWLDIDGRIVDFSLAVRGMTGRPIAAGSRVIGRLSAGDWEFTAANRTIVVQALWSVSKGTRARAGSQRRGANRSISIPVVIGDSTYRAAVSTDTFDIALSKLLPSGSDQSHGAVEVTRRGRTVVWRDGQQRRNNRVVVNRSADKPLLTGQTGQARLPNPARLIREQLELEEAADGWYALSREFVFAAVGAEQAAADTLDERRQEKLDRYLDNPRPVRAMLHEDTFILADIEVRAGAGWTNRVRAGETELAWVDGNDYDAGQTQVLLHRTANGYVATCRDAPSRTLDQFVREFHLGTSLQADQDVPRLYFAGAVATPAADEAASATETRVRFEWGYGQTLAVPLSRIQVGNTVVEQVNDLPMFFGDHIRRIRLKHVPQTSEYLLDIRAAEVWPSDEKQLADQAWHDIVVRVDVTIDADRDDVRVHGALSRPKRLVRPGDASGPQGLARYRTRQASLDPDSRKEILGLFRKAGGSGVEHTQVLAKMDHDSFTQSRGNTVLFHYRRLSTDRNVPHHLRAGDRIFLTGGLLKRSRNDVRLVFGIPGQLATWNNADDLDEVDVPRRNFSVREAVLRRYVERGDDFLVRRTFLVKLLGPTRANRGPGVASWSGEIKDSPAREARSLSGLLRATDAPVYATVVGTEMVDKVRRLRLEIEAGTTVSLPLDRISGGNHERGSVVRVERDRSGMFDLFLAVRGDRAFIGTGRPAVVFPIDAVGSWRDPAAVRTPCLVVAGLPDVQAHAGQADANHGDGDALTRIMAMPHPKIVTLRSRGKGVSATALGPDTRVASVIVNSGRVTAEAAVVIGSVDRRPMPWSDLSFADSTALDIADRVAATRWWYIDHSTRTWRAGDPQDAYPSDVPVATAASQPLFFGAGWTLRYPEDEIRSLAYSTNELFDYTNMSGVVDVHGVVAGVVRDGDGTPVGLWVERAPGRVVEIMGDLLVLDRQDEVPLSAPVPLAAAHWAAFATGDRIDLRVVGAGSDNPNLQFVSWRPGPRGAFGTQRVLLPVINVDAENGALVLGAGRCVVTYPLTPDEAGGYLPGSAVWLHPDNRIRPVADLSDVWPDDVVLLASQPAGAEETRLYAIRGVDVAVRPSDDSSAWVGSEWLAEVLRDTDRARELLRLCGGALPVTVEERDACVVTVSRRHQPPCALPPGSLVLATILGLLDDRVVLRAGSVLLTMPASTVVPCHPEAVREELFDILAARGETVWLRADDGGCLRSGVAPPDQPVAEGSDVYVSPEVVVGEDEAVTGVVCRRADTLGLAWLPAAEAAWTRLDRDQLTRQLVRSSRLPLAQVRRDGTVSLVAAAPVRERFASLGVGDTIRVVVVDKPVLRDGQSDRYVYLAKAYLTDILLEFESGYAGHWGSGEPVLAEVALRRAKPTPTLAAVGHGERLISVDLPDWLLRSLQEPDYVGARFAPYESCYSTPSAPIPHDPDDASDSDHFPDHASLRVVAAAGAVSDTLDNSARAALAAWLLRHGEDAFGLRNDRSLDLFPLLAVVQLLDVLGRESDSSAGAAAVELCRQIGLRAARSRHLEPLLTHWVLNPDRDAAPRLWRRLTTLSWNAALPPKQFNIVYDCVSGLLPRAVATGDRELRLVSLSLLAALGRLPSFDDMEAYDGYLRGLVHLGRALTGGGPELAAQSALLDSQRELLRDVLQELRDAGGVMTLLRPAVTSGSTAGRKLLERVLAELEGRSE